MARRSPVSRDRRFKPAAYDAKRPDHGPAERWQHGARGFAFTERAGIFAARALEETLLDRLARRGQVSELQASAGLRLRADFQLARLGSVAAANYGALRQKHQRGLGVRTERTAAQERAYQRWRAALLACAPSQRDVVINLCCLGFLAPDDVPAAQEALTRLAAHYGLNVQGARPGRIRILVCGTAAGTSET